MCGGSRANDTGHPGASQSTEVVHTCLALADPDQASYCISYLLGQERIRYHIANDIILFSIHLDLMHTPCC